MRVASFEFVSSCRGLVLRNSLVTQKSYSLLVLAAGTRYWYSLLLTATRCCYSLVFAVTLWYSSLVFVAGTRCWYWLVLAAGARWYSLLLAALFVFADLLILLIRHRK